MLVRRGTSRRECPSWISWYAPGSVFGLSAGQVVGDKYRLTRVLAHGGMGAVWVARHVELDVDVAVKTITFAHGERGSELRARFRREAKVAARLRGPNIVRISDYGVQDDTPYLVMELLEGEDLRARLDRTQVSSVSEATRILSGVAAALEVAHAEGVVHRDVKPSNVFLAQEGGVEVVKLLDFGVAKALADDLTADATTTGQTVGSPRYMSPEQVRSAPFDQRSDIWSLGAVAFEMLAGRPLFDAQAAGDVMGQVLCDPIPKLSECVDGLPRELDNVLLRALAREPQDRYASALAFAQDFAAIARRHGAMESTGRARSPVKTLGRSSTTMATPPGDDKVESIHPVASSPLPGATLGPRSSPRRRAGLVGGGIAMIAIVAVAYLVSRGSAEPAPATAMPSAEPEVETREAPEPVPAAPSTSAPVVVPTTTAVAAPPQPKRAAPYRPAAKPKPQPKSVTRDSDFGIPIKTAPAP